MHLNIEAFQKYTKLNRKIPEEIVQTLRSTTNVENFLQYFGITYKFRY